MSERILIVDDDAPVRRMLARTIAAEGYAVDEAGDGGAALIAVDRASPDLVVLDVAMPGLDGIEVCRRVRQLSIDFRPVMVALSGWGREEDRRRTTEAGFDHHLVKPVAMKKVRDLLQSVLLVRRDLQSKSELALSSAGTTCSPVALVSD